MQRAAAGVSKATLLRRLEELLAAGLVERAGKARATRYTLTPEGRRNVFNRALIDLAWNSSRLEGNTFSLLETDRLLALGRSEDPTRVIGARMLLNHKEAIEFLVDAPDDIGFNRYTALNLHALLASDLLETSHQEGPLRQIAVGIGGCSYLPLDTPQVVEECFQQILDKAATIDDPLEAAFFCMVHLPYLHPFIDVNKRVSRLAANIPLIRENMAPLAFADAPARDYTDAILAVYELNRVELLCDVFARAYRSSAGRDIALLDDPSEKARAQEDLEKFLKNPPHAAMADFIGVGRRTLYSVDPESPEGIVQVLPDGTRIRGAMVNRKFVPATTLLE